MFKKLSARLKRMSTTGVVVLAATISLVALIGWVAFCISLWGMLRLFQVQFDMWSMLEALSTAAAVAQVFGGGIVALWQLKDASEGRNLDIYNAVFEKLMSDEDIEARRWIYQELPDNPEQGLDQLDPKGQAHVKRVLNSLDHLGFLMRQNWVTEEAEEAVIEWVNPFVVKVWAKLGPYIDYESRRRNQPDYYIAVRELAQRCVEWRRRHLPDSAEVVWVDKKTI